MQNFMQIPPRGASRQMGEIYAKTFIYIYVFFLPRTHRSDSLRDLTLNTSNDAVLHKEVPFGG